MGLFSSRTRTHVASSVWNMAGDVALRPKVLPSIVIGASLSGSSVSLGEHIQAGLRSSTSMNSRAFFRWARNSYALGMPSGHLGAAMAVRGPGIPAALKAALSLGSNQRVRLLSSKVDDADPNYWAEVWVTRNHPRLNEEDWTVELDQARAELSISMPAATARIPVPADLLWGMVRNGRKLLYLAYELQTRQANGLWQAGDPQLFTYRMGTGNAVFDRLQPVQENLAEFYPAIPLRLHNRSVEDIDEIDFPAMRKAFKRLTGGKIEDVLTQLEEHESIGDMDHVMAVPAVSLNSETVASKAYIYEFFRFLMQHQQTQVNAEQFLTQQYEGLGSVVAWERWQAANGENGRPTNPSWNAPAPEGGIGRVENDTNELQIRMSEMPEFDFRIRWTGIEETVHVGNANRFDGNQTRPLAKKGTYWLRVLPDIEIANSNMGFGLGRLVNSVSGSRLAIFHQYEARRYRRLNVIGLQHYNYVYGSNAVIMSMRDAMGEEEESGFLLPLHYPTLRKLSLVHNAELASSSTYLVINSYERVKVRWYQRGIFKIVMIAAAIGFSIWTAGASLGSTVGLLGTNAAVGASLGASAALAAVVGAVANGIAAVVLTTVIGKASVEIFGDKWGAIIAAVITTVTLQVTQGFHQTGQVQVDWGNLMRADNLMSLTDSVMGMATAGLNEDTLAMQREAAEMAENYEEELAKIEELSQEILGMTPQLIDPMLFTDASEHFGERSEVFLDRTLLTGSDLAQMTHSLIERFAELSLKLPGT